VRVSEAVGTLPHHIHGDQWLQIQAAWTSLNEYFEFPGAEHRTAVAPVDQKDLRLFQIPQQGDEEKNDDDDEVTLELIAAQAELLVSLKKTESTKLRFTHLIGTTRDIPRKLQHLDQAERMLERQYRDGVIPAQQILHIFSESLCARGITSRAELTGGIPHARLADEPIPSNLLDALAPLPLPPPPRKRKREEGKENDAQPMQLC